MLEPFRQLEDALDVGLGRARAHDPRARAPAQEQVEGTGEHRLARSRLPRDHVQSRRELEARVFDQQQVLDGQLEQHAPTVYQQTGTERGAPAATPRVAEATGRASRTSRAAGGRSSTPPPGAASRHRRRSARAVISCGAISPTGRPSTDTVSASSEPLRTRQLVVGRDQQRACAQRVRRDERNRHARDAPCHHRPAVGEVVAGGAGRGGDDEAVAAHAADLLPGRPRRTARRRAR